MKGKEGLEVNIGGTIVKENAIVKTLGVKFDGNLNFKQYWSDLSKTLWQKVAAINALQGSLPFKQRKLLGEGLIISRLSYCIESTSCCPKTMLKAPGKLLNKAARSIVREWRQEETPLCYHALGWLRLDELAIFRTYIMGRKILERRDPGRLLERIAEKDEHGNWNVKPPEKKTRTEIGRQTFSGRFGRLWSIMEESDKAILLKNKAELQKFKLKIGKFDKNWILWGIKEDKNETNQINENEDDEGNQNQDEDNEDHSSEEDFDAENTTQDERYNESEEYTGAVNVENEDNSKGWSGSELLSLIMIETIEQEADFEEKLARENNNGKVKNKEDVQDEIVKYTRENIHTITKEKQQVPINNINHGLYKKTKRKKIEKDRNKIQEPFSQENRNSKNFLMKQRRCTFLVKEKQGACQWSRRKKRQISALLDRS